MKSNMYRFVILVSIALLLSGVSALAVEMKNSDNSIPTNVVDSTGGSSESTDFRIYQVVGQATPVGESTDETSTYMLQAGHIYTLNTGLTVAPSALTIESIYISGTRFLSGDIIPASGHIRAHLLDQNGVVLAQARIYSSVTYVDLSLTSGTSTDGYWVGDYSVGEGAHTITIWTQDGLGNQTEPAVGAARVMGGTVQVVGTPLNYPNPFSPLSDDPTRRTTRIQYSLSSNANIILAIYDITGKEVKRIVSGAGQDGGKAGVNSVYWNGKTIFGDTASNGMFVYKIIAGGKVIATGKLVVLD
jgi:hypothetical protein